MKHILGVKSSGYIGMNVFAFIILSLLLVLVVVLEVDLDGSENWMIYFIVGCVIYLILDIIIQSRKPSTLMSYDDVNLYLHYASYTETIELQQIKQAIPKRTRAKLTTYSFGKVIIYTTKGEYSIGIVSDCEQVCIELMNVVIQRIKQENNT